MSIDVAAVRADTAGTGHVTHLDSAGSSLMPRPVAYTVVAHLRREEQIGGCRAAAESAGRLEGVYSSLARLVGAAPEEIAVLESGSTAWATAVSGLPLTGPRVLLSRTEYWHNVLVLRRLARRHRLELVVLDDDASGRVDLEHLQRELDRGDVGLVALTHVPMAGAQVQPAAEVGRLCRTAGAAFVLDACQSVGQLPPGRRRARPRHPGRHRAEVPARAPRHRLRARPPRGAGPARAGSRPGCRRAGRRAWRTGWGWAGRWTTPSTPGSRRSGPG